MSPTHTRCPTCGRSIEWSAAAPFRPFCSERCKLIDLGAWLSEQRAVPGEPIGASDAQREDTDPGTDEQS